jgi:hypothetical protein
VTRPFPVVLDEFKLLRRAVLDVFDNPVEARCQPRNCSVHLSRWAVSTA